MRKEKDGTDRTRGADREIAQNPVRGRMDRILVRGDKPEIKPVAVEVHIQFRGRCLNHLPLRPMHGFFPDLVTGGGIDKVHHPYPCPDLAVFSSYVNHSTSAIDPLVTRNS